VSSGATLDLRDRVRDVPDFPKPGIVFKDLMPLVGDATYFREAIDRLEELARPLRPDVILGAEARGFILAAPVALALGAGFVPVRKAGKLPGPTYAVSYALEYGEATLEMHQDAFREGERVLLVDDVLATGGTAAATRQLVEQGGARTVALSVLMELSALGGRRQIGDLPLQALSVR